MIGFFCELNQVVNDFDTSMDANMIKKCCASARKLEICKNVQGAWGPLRTLNVIFRLMLCIKIVDILTFICFLLCLFKN